MDKRWRASRLAEAAWLGFGLLVAVLTFSGCGPAQTKVPTSVPSPAAHTISGRVSYAGSELANDKIIVQVRGSAGQGATAAPLYSVVISGPGSYTLSGVPDNTYVVWAFIDLNGDAQVQLGEPVGFYKTGKYGWSADPVVISGGIAATGVDLTILDQSAPPPESPAPTVDASPA